MALRTTISSANRVVDQGNTYQYEVEPAVTNTCLAKEPTTDGGVAIFDRQSVTQWHGIVHFSKRYRYIGLDQATAEAQAEAILNAYTQTAEKWAVGIKTIGQGSNAGAMYCYVSVGQTAPMSCATVTPVHVEGPIWEIEVDVNATFEKYTEPTQSSLTQQAVGASQGSSQAPTASELKNLASAIANFPEDSGSGGNNNVLGN
jgi:hypothetical protein